MRKLSLAAVSTSCAARAVNINWPPDSHTEQTGHIRPLPHTATNSRAGFNINASEEHFTRRPPGFTTHSSTKVEACYGRACEVTRQHNGRLCSKVPSSLQYGQVRYPEVKCVTTYIWMKHWRWHNSCSLEIREHSRLVKSPTQSTSSYLDFIITIITFPMKIVTHSDRGIFEIN